VQTKHNIISITGKPFFVLGNIGNAAGAEKGGRFCSFWQVNGNHLPALEAVFIGRRLPVFSKCAFRMRCLKAFHVRYAVSKSASSAAIGVLNKTVLWPFLRKA